LVHTVFIGQRADQRKTNTMSNIIEVNSQFDATRSAVTTIKVGDQIARTNAGGHLNEVIEVGELLSVLVGARAGKCFRLVTWRTTATGEMSTTIREN